MDERRLDVFFVMEQDKEMSDKLPTDQAHRLGRSS